MKTTIFKFLIIPALLVATPGAQAIPPGSPVTERSTKDDRPDFDEPDRQGNRSGADSRGNCGASSINLTALMPSSNLGRTVVAQPTLWFYIPYSSEQIAFGTFALQDSAGNDVTPERLQFSPPENPGFASLTLPQEVLLADVGDEYRWFLELHCVSENGLVYVDGWVQRAALPDTQTADPPERIYGENGIWLDAINYLGQRRAQDPTDTELLERWNHLLALLGLETLPAEPFVGSLILDE
ncbi:MAG: DUF928 domain-containing protein [Cyanobacteria bacterium P01_D01_bin.2]